MFQFQTGAIKSETLQEIWASDEFQFQTGAIKSENDQRISVMSFPCFNSKLVRLKGRRVRFGEVAITFVSIPNWCD